MHQENTENSSSPALPQSQQAGLILKNLREQKGLSVHELSQITRIQRNYIEALEEGRLDDLPGHFFISSFIRYIGKELGVSPETIKEICQLAAGVTTPPPSSELADAPKTPSSLEKTAKSGTFEPLIKSVLPKIKQKSQNFKIPNWFNRKRTLKLVRLIGITSLCLLGVYGIVKYGRIPLQSVEPRVEISPEKPAVMNPQPVSTDPEPVAEPSSQELVENSGENLPANIPAASEVIANTASKTAKLGILVKETVDMRKSCDGLSSERFSLTPGQYNYEFEQQCEVMIYDAGSVEVFLNDKPLGSLGQKKRIRRLAFVNERPDAKVQ